MSWFSAAHAVRHRHGTIVAQVFFGVDESVLRADDKYALIQLTERNLGPPAAYVPGDVTTEYVKTIAAWVKPKDRSVSSALLSTGKCLPAAVAIMMGTPAAMLEDTVISIVNVTRKLLGAAPAGAYLPPGQERVLARELERIERTMVRIKTCRK